MFLLVVMVEREEYLLEYLGRNCFFFWLFVDVFGWDGGLFGRVMMEGLVFIFKFRLWFFFFGFIEMYLGKILMYLYKVVFDYLVFVLVMINFMWIELILNLFFF